MSCHSHDNFQCEYPNRGIYISDPAEYPDLFESNADSSYISGKQRNSDLVLRWRNCVILHLLEICGFFLVNCPSDCFYISSRKIFILLKTLLLQGDQQTKLLLIILRGKIDMIMI